MPVHSVFFVMLAPLPHSPAAADDIQTPQPGGPLRDYLQKFALQQLSLRREEINRIRTPEQFAARRAEVRRRFLAMLGGLPEERSPLHVRKMGTIDQGDYRVEKIVYESLPKFYVTANLYVPQTGQASYPAVLQPTGHSVAAKARAFYQTLSLGLVKQGFVVLTYDPLGQGERRFLRCRARRFQSGHHHDGAPDDRYPESARR